MFRKPISNAVIYRNLTRALALGSLMFFTPMMIGCASQSWKVNLVDDNGSYKASTEPKLDDGYYEFLDADGKKVRVKEQNVKDVREE